MQRSQGSTAQASVSRHVREQTAKTNGKSFRLLNAIITVNSCSILQCYPTVSVLTPESNVASPFTGSRIRKAASILSFQTLVARVVSWNPHGVQIKKNCSVGEKFTNS